MKILFLILFPLSVYAMEKPFIISGFDDVLRQSENTGPIQATLAIFKEDKTFAGMPELYQILSAQEEGPKFVILSAIPDWFEGKVEQFLSNNHYPPRLKILRNWPFEWSIEEFKIRHIETIIRFRRSRRFIIIFDNSEASLRLSEKLPKLFPEILTVYLRQVSKRNTPRGAHQFFTAFDIAYQEYLSGRLSSDDLEKIGRIILKETRGEKIIPTYAVCPLNYETCTDKEICREVSAHIRKLCQH